MDRLKHLSLVALIGPTNAGKSTLFNRLTGSFQAITAREESTTRDRVYGEVEWQGQRLSLVDTGGLVDDKSQLYASIKQQMLTAVEEADLILFVYDGREGLRPPDQQFLDSLRPSKTIWLIANKVDTPSLDKSVKNLDYLGLPFYKISAATGRGVGDLLEAVNQTMPESASQGGAVADNLSDEPIVAIVGRPNVGKSTLLNALTKSQRAVVSPIAGTTRDIVTARLTTGGKALLLVDTAGVRRRGSIDVGVEKFSVKRTLLAINHAKRVIIVVDAFEGTTRSDLHLIYYANELKKPVLVVFNKSDLLNDRPIVFHHHIAKFDQAVVSALTGDGLEKVFDWLLTPGLIRV